MHLYVWCCRRGPAGAGTATRSQITPARSTTRWFFAALIATWCAVVPILAELPLPPRSHWWRQS